MAVQWSLLKIWPFSGLKLSAVCWRFGLPLVSVVLHPGAVYNQSGGGTAVGLQSGSCLVASRLQPGNHLSVVALGLVAQVSECSLLAR